MNLTACFCHLHSMLHPILKKFLGGRQSKQKLNFTDYVNVFLVIEIPSPALGQVRGIFLFGFL